MAYAPAHRAPNAIARYHAIDARIRAVRADTPKSGALAYAEAAAVVAKRLFLAVEEATTDADTPQQLAFARIAEYAVALAEEHS